MAGLTLCDDLGTGRPLVLLHGWSVDASLFAAQRPLAGQGFRVITADLPGHGRDPRRGAGLTIADLGDALAASLADLALAGAVLVGWSMGATVALDHLARHGSGGIAGLVIVDMTAKVPNAPGWPLGLSNGQTLEETLAAADRMAAGWPRYAPRIAEAMFAPGIDLAGEPFRRAAAAVAASDGPTMAGLWRSLVRADHRDTLARLDRPVLALAGAESRLYRPAVAAWIAGTAPHGRMLSLAGAGHSPHAEAPAAFNAALADFAASLG
ncbi:AB hydrolase superfamily protein YdjP [bacterium YEK0313]|nr:AB hydrolase superfamily protein YdjP [bacterium YEK0313]